MSTAEIERSARIGNLVYVRVLDADLRAASSRPPPAPRHSPREQRPGPGSPPPCAASAELSDVLAGAGGKGVVEWAIPI